MEGQKVALADQMLQSCCTRLSRKELKTVITAEEKQAAREAGYRKDEILLNEFVYFVLAMQNLKMDNI